MISAIPNPTWTVVRSRGHSRNPQKRELEKAIAEVDSTLTAPVCPKNRVGLFGECNNTVLSILVTQTWLRNER